MPEVVLRTGIDLLDIDRLNSLAPAIRSRFMKRVFTDRELAQAKDAIASLAGLFCAKEAVSKALGCGIGAISWQEIEILSDTRGAPWVTLSGKAARLAEEMGLSTWSVSITHTRQVAAATVTAIGFTAENEDPIR